jgi:hypothetical protein
MFREHLKPRKSTAVVVKGKRAEAKKKKDRDSSPISTTIHSKELIAKQLGQMSGATGRTRNSVRDIASSFVVASKVVWQ